MVTCDTESPITLAHAVVHFAESCPFSPFKFIPTTKSEKVAFVCIWNLEASVRPLAEPQHFTMLQSSHIFGFIAESVKCLLKVVNDPIQPKQLKQPEREPQFKSLGPMVRFQNCATTAVRWVAQGNCCSSPKAIPTQNIYFEQLSATANELRCQVVSNTLKKQHLASAKTTEHSRAQRF